MLFYNIVRRKYDEQYENLPEKQEAKNVLKGIQKTWSKTYPKNPIGQVNGAIELHRSLAFYTTLQGVLTGKTERPNIIVYAQILPNFPPLKRLFLNKSPAKNVQKNLLYELKTGNLRHFLKTPYRQLGPGLGLT